VSYQQIFARAGGPGESSVMNAPAGSISIAVLPFLNLSGDPNQEFFSDGMTEEITSALARVPSLRVVGRTSAFEFKGQNKDLRVIGQALGAGYILEGSIRKEGSQIRVTGQLIKADDGTHIWTENYDRELKSVFAIQDDIAQAIASALQAPLGLNAGESLVTSRAVSPDNYQKYLAAKAIVHGRGLGKAASDLTTAIQLLEVVVEDDPAFAPAFALLGYAYALLPGPGNLVPPGVPDNSRAVIQEYFDKSQSAASKAIQLDPKHVGGYLALAYAKAMGGHWAAAEDLFKQALALDADDPDVLHEYSVVLGRVGKVSAALKMREQLLASDPLVAAYKILAGQQLRLAGRPADSVRILEEVPPAFSNRNTQLVISYAAVGRFSEAADLLLATDGPRPQDREQAAKFLRIAPKKLQEVGALPPLYVFSFVYLYVGAPDRALDYSEREVDVGHMISAPRILEPEYSGLRKTARFKAILRKSGLVDYWRARGWPDVCRPVGADDFECD